MSDLRPIEKEAVEFIECFKRDMLKISKEVLGRIYVDLVPHIESDAWLNFRNDARREIQGDAIKDCLSNEYGQYSFGWTTRQKIFEEHKDELIKALNKDLMDKINRLEEELKRAYERYR